MPLITDTGFQPLEDLDYVAAADLEAPQAAGLWVDMPNDYDPAQIRPHFNEIDLIRIPFPSFADGRGFSLARRLRDFGFQGRLRAVGHVISDQYAYARGCGFDEVEISDDLAARQPEAEWLSAAKGRESYRRKLHQSNSEI